MYASSKRITIEVLGQSCKYSSVYSKQKSNSFSTWFGFNPDLNIVQIFGCLRYSQVPRVKRDKLDKRAEPGIFIGYSTISKTGNIFTNRDVHLKKDEKWCWTDLEESECCTGARRYNR